MSATVIKSTPVVFDKLPRDLNELKAIPGSELNDPNMTAALLIAALDLFPKDREASIEMINYLKGPKPLSNFDISFINDRFMDGVDYIPRSYFKGTSPENDYTPDQPYTLNILELVHSRDQLNEGYLKLFLRSSGADSERYLILRNKPSTNQWFVWDFPGILVGIRQPKSKDPWA